jgi:transposase-like protein
MTRMGRPPLGAKLVDALEGSKGAKDRLRAILSTITGESSVAEAARSIDCNEAYLYSLRGRFLQEGLEGLEPRKPGRKPKLTDEKDEEIARLRHELEKVQHVLTTLGVRLELATSGVSRRQKKRHTPPT